MRKLSHGGSSKSRVGQMEVNVPEQNIADVGEGGKAGHPGFVIVCPRLCLGDSHTPAAESFSGNHR